jgi:hypothetical protein
MSLLPSFALEAVEETEEIAENTIEMPYEYGIDFETGQLTGTIVEGVEAIKVWIWLALHIERYRFPIFSWDYGAELDQYIGKSYSKEYLDADVKETVTDCLLQNDHITDIDDFSVELDGEKILKSFHVETDIGGIDLNV